MNKLINSEVNRCVLDDAMTGPRLERGARRCMSACHEQLDVWLRHTSMYRCSMQQDTVGGVDQRAYDPTAVAAAMQLSRF